MLSIIIDMYVFAEITDAVSFENSMMLTFYAMTRI